MDVLRNFDSIHFTIFPIDFSNLRSVFIFRNRHGTIVSHERIILNPLGIEGCVASSACRNLSYCVTREFRVSIPTAKGVAFSGSCFSKLSPAFYVICFITIRIIRSHIGYRVLFQDFPVYFQIACSSSLDIIDFFAIPRIFKPSFKYIPFCNIRERQPKTAFSCIRMGINALIRKIAYRTIVGYRIFNSLPCWVKYGILILFIRSIEIKYLCTFICYSPANLVISSSCIGKAWQCIIFIMYFFIRRNKAKTTSTSFINN